MATGDIATAEKIDLELPSETAKLYLKAAILRAKKQPQAAIKVAVDVIADHGNDLDWMPANELLCAKLYLDMGMTNSAVQTARQVEHLYAGTHISADAKKMHELLDPPKPEGSAVKVPVDEGNVPVVEENEEVAEPVSEESVVSETDSSLEQDGVATNAVKAEATQPND